MKCSHAIVLVFVVTVGFARQVGAGEQQNGVDLFDGKSLAGWEHFLVKPDVPLENVWRVADGLLVCQGKPMGYLATRKEYKNFRLVVEWRWAPDGPATNSGILLRITGKPQALPRCAEVQLKAGNAGDVLGFHGFQVTGDQKRAISAQSELFGKLSGVTKKSPMERNPGKWNRAEITLVGGDISVKINGEQVNSATGLDDVPGKIALQSEGGEIHFRTVKLFPLE